ncbi:MAG: hypothetical protein J1E07_10655, partial [Treponema sp.]|nr:hypothetical protein [Treponema sp.]
KNIRVSVSLVPGDVAFFCGKPVLVENGVVDSLYCVKNLIAAQLLQVLSFLPFQNLNVCHSPPLFVL